MLRKHVHRLYDSNTTTVGQIKRVQALSMSNQLPKVVFKSWYSHFTAQIEAKKNITTQHAAVIMVYLKGLKDIPNIKQTKSS